MLFKRKCTRLITHERWYIQSYSLLKIEGTLK